MPPSEPRTSTANPPIATGWVVRRNRSEATTYEWLDDIKVETRDGMVIDVWTWTPLETSAYRMSKEQAEIYADASYFEAVTYYSPKSPEQIEAETPTRGRDAP